MVKEKLFNEFTRLGISSREELRERIQEIEVKEVNQQIIEGYYAEYRKIFRDNREILSSQPTIKVVAIGDLHIPYHNKVMVKNFAQFCKDEQPDQIILGGDIVDFYDLSSFDKNPDRLNNLQDEISECVDFIKNLRKACPDSKLVYIIGNHEDRLRRFLWKNPQLASLEALKLEELLQFKKYKVEFCESYFINGFEYTHGDLVRKHSSYSAKCEFENRGHSGMSHHVHRGGSYYKTTHDGTYGWFENFCGCDLNPEYIKGTPNWQNGFHLNYHDDNAFDIHPIYVNKGHFRANGKKY